MDVYIRGDESISFLFLAKGVGQIVIIHLSLSLSLPLDIRQPKQPNSYSPSKTHQTTQQPAKTPLPSQT